MFAYSENLEVIKELFNIGKLKLMDAYWYYVKGYDIVLAHGKVSYIIESERNDDLIV